MDISALMALLAGIVGLIGGIAGILSWVNQRRQTRLMQEQVDAFLLQNKQYAEWSTTYDQAVDVLSRVYQSVIHMSPTKTVHALKLVFPDENLRRRIERYLGKPKFLTSKFQPYQLNKEQLLNPVVQEVLTQILECCERFKREHTDWAREIHLL